VKAAFLPVKIPPRSDGFTPRDCAAGDFHYGGRAAMSVHSDFRSRHLGSIGSDREEMLRAIGYDSLDTLADAAVPAGIRLEKELVLPEAKSEPGALAWLKSIFSRTSSRSPASAKAITAPTSPA
jgi:glycine dehydrogenase